MLCNFAVVLLALEVLAMYLFQTITLTILNRVLNFLGLIVFFALKLSRKVKACSLAENRHNHFSKHFFFHNNKFHHNYFHNVQYHNNNYNKKFNKHINLYQQLNDNFNYNYFNIKHFDFYY